jgi:hypothetical protein
VSSIVVTLCSSSASFVDVLHSLAYVNIEANFDMNVLFKGSTHTRYIHFNICNLVVGVLSCVSKWQKNKLHIWLAMRNTNTMYRLKV